MAKNTRKLAVRLTDKEQIWSIVYLLFSFFLLPELLQLLGSALPLPLGKVWYNFLYFTINFIFIFWILHGFFKRSLVYCGRNMGNFLLAVVIGSALYWLCNWGYSQLLRRFFPGYLNLNDSSIGGMISENFLLMFLGTVLFVPITEEAFHRALIFGSLYPKSPAIAYILSAVIFASIHIVGFVGVYAPLNLALAFLQYIPAGLILAWVYRRSGSIFAPVLMHAVINTVGMFAQR
jgi:membrane protease YdiL (CAAX protease family)